MDVSVFSGITVSLWYVHHAVWCVLVVFRNRSVLSALLTSKFMQVFGQASLIVCLPCCNFLADFLHCLEYQFLTSRGFRVKRCEMNHVLLLGELSVAR